RGYYFLIDDEPYWAGWAGQIAVNVQDLVNVACHPRPGRWNRVCREGHCVGTEVSEWWTAHAMFFDLPCSTVRIRTEPTGQHSVSPGAAGETVQQLARAIDADRAFDRLPLLADALEDAGCNNADILEHCRSATEHVRGCWVVDLLLGKE